MKKILLLMLWSIGIFMFSNAQKVELLGLGVKEAGNTVTLPILDPGTVDRVVVEAAAVFHYDPSGTPSDVIFSTVGETDVTAPYVACPVFPDNGVSWGNPEILEGKEVHWGYYTAEFNSVGASGITLNKNGQGDSIVSFTAYVYRTYGAPTMMYYKLGDPTFVFLNSSANPLEYTFTLPAVSGNRNIEVAVPFSDVASDPNNLRWAHVTLMAGGSSASSEFQTNKDGKLLSLERLVLNDVPGNVTEVKVQIYSPYTPDAKLGDSFITSGVVLMVEEEEQDGGCTLTQGYWKTHGDPGNEKKYDKTWDLVGGPGAPFFSSGKSYMEVLETPSAGGNAYYILAHQYIAAELNFLAGADDSAVRDDFDDATELFGDPNNYTPGYIGGLEGDDPLRAEFIRLSGNLDDYNNGVTGPGHCDEDENEEESNNEIKPVKTVSTAVVKTNNGKAKGKNKSAIIPADIEVVSISELSVYPNPVSNTATISFNPAQDGRATVDLYNSMGQRASRLMDQNVWKDIPVSFRMNGQEYNDGLYIIRVQNGSSVETTKIKIQR